MKFEIWNLKLKFEIEIWDLKFEIWYLKFEIYLILFFINKLKLNNNKYYTWYVTSKSKPSYLYLSDGISDANGNPTNYCLDLDYYVNDNNKQLFTYCKLFQY